MPEPFKGEGAPAIVRAPHHRGMTLIELLIGMAIGLFLVLVMGSIYLGSKGTFNAQESTARLQENARYAVDLLSNDLRMGGFRGCAGQVAGVGQLTNELQGPLTTVLNFGQGVAGSHNVGGAWSPGLDASIGALAPNPAGDVLTIYRSFGTAWALTADMTLPTDSLQVTPSAAFNTGDILVVADCNSSAVLQITNANPGATGTIAHVAGAAGVVPGVATSSLDRPYLQDAVVYRVQAVTYYLAPSLRQPGTMALWSSATPAYTAGPQPIELVTGVDRMVVTYGLDTNGDQAADTFVTADAVANWSQVVSARLELLLSSPDANGATTPQPYTYAGVVTTPTDRRLRTVVSLVTSLRNAVP
ncbi:MAG: PilW family protein [Burkholderiales bacterium]|nr:PilW family protein [Burkholderiales bacterium]MDE1926857.1 PilW family protein [Burkholderiales bacterium]MDE2159499.1 PilW family protein [Burkholderiales bacterium]MDE2503701.1 PilW family protein [Burkholderiales bacterium]